MAGVHAHVRRQRRLGIDWFVRHDDNLVAGVDDFTSEMLQQVLGVITNARAAGGERRAVEGDQHVTPALCDGTLNNRPAAIANTT